MAIDVKNVEKARAEIRELLSNIVALGCEQNAAECRIDKAYRRAAIWDRLAEGLRADVRKARVEQASNYASLFEAPVGNLSNGFSFGKRSYDDNGLDSTPSKPLDGPSVRKSTRDRNYNDSGL